MDRRLTRTGVPVSRSHSHPLGGISYRGAIVEQKSNFDYFESAEPRFFAAELPYRWENENCYIRHWLT
jgi:hypothetical protein